MKFYLKNRLFVSFFCWLFLIMSLHSCDSDKKNELSISNNNEYLNGKPLNYHINDFIWRALNNIYLWQSKIPNLADSRISDKTAYVNFLGNYSSPSIFFEALLYKKNKVDRFSFLSTDYTILEKTLSGTTKSNGMAFGLTSLPSSNSIVGYVKYVLKESDADKKGIKRGDFFGFVNGIKISKDNYRTLLFSNANSYSIGLLKLEKNTFSSTNRNVTLTKTESQQNPIQKSEILNINGSKVGYIMLNGFYSNYDEALNNIFGKFKSEGIRDLILDLRYNPGGSVNTARYLASMITGSHAGEVFFNTVWNEKYQDFFKKNNPMNLIGRFPSKINDGSSINAVNVNKVYILTSSNTASASELVISGLYPYLNVFVIGTNTVGKYMVSTTLYDSLDFSKKGVTSSHKYALQPLIFKYSNLKGVTDFDSGLTPNIELKENLSNLGILGRADEPLLARALQEIKGVSSGDGYYENTSFFVKDIIETKGMLHMNLQEIMRL